MPGKTVTLSGWKAVVAFVAFLVFMGVRIASVGDHVNNEALHQQVMIELNSEFYPDQVNRLQAALAMATVIALMQPVQKCSAMS